MHRFVRSAIAPACAFLFIGSGCAEGGSGATSPPASDATLDVEGDVALVDATPETRDGSIFPIDESGGETAPSPCASMPLTSWQKPTKLAKLRGVAGSPITRDPYVLPDGKTLLFMASDSAGKQRIHQSTRASSSDVFEGGALIEGLDTGATKDVDLQQAAARRLDEVIFIGPTAPGDVWVATRAGSSGPFVSRRWDEAFLNTADLEASPTLTVDGERMVFARLVAGNYSLFEARRLGGGPGSSWQAVAPLEGLEGKTYSIACPAISADGLTLFFATNEEAPGTAKSSVFVATRATRSAPFGAPVAVPALGYPGQFNCPRSITADGCELYLTTDSDGDYVSHVARRAP